MGVICVASFKFCVQYHFAYFKRMVSSTFLLFARFVVYNSVGNLEKIVFAKIRLTDEGVCRFFGDEIINKICWNDVVEVRVLAKRCVYFLDKPYDEKVIPLNYKTNICFNLTKKNFANLLQFKEKFKDKITDISLLSESQKRLLLD